MERSVLRERGDYAYKLDGGHERGSLDAAGRTGTTLLVLFVCWVGGPLVSVLAEMCEET